MVSTGIRETSKRERNYVAEFPTKKVNKFDTIKANTHARPPRRFRPKRKDKQKPTA